MNGEEPRRTPMASEKLALLFNTAADRIQEFGWWDGSYGRNGMTGPGRECFWTAILTAAGILGVRMDRPMITEVEVPVFAHFGIDGSEPDVAFTMLFELNDKQLPGYGQLWAVSNLRALAAKALAG